MILIDLEDDRHRLDANLWTWRPAIELMASFDILSSQTLEMMGYNCGAEVNAEQAHSIGQKIIAEVLPQIAPQERLLLGLTTTDESDDGKMHYDDTFKNYSATRDWLVEFADFCLKSQGFKVY